MTVCLKTFPAILAIACLSSLAVAAPADQTAPSVLTLQDLLVAAMNANVELSAKRIDPQIQDLRVSAALGAFEPNAVAGGSYSSNERHKTAAEISSLSSIFGGTTDPILREDSSRLQVGFNGKLPTGTTYELLTGIEQDRNSYNKFTSEFISTSTFNLTQPLWKNFGYAANLAEVRLQRKTAEVSRFETQTIFLRILRDVTNAYYEMAFAQEDIRVKAEAVAVAASLVRDNQRRLDEGKMAPIDVTQAQSRLSEAKEELLIARNFLAQRRNILKELTHDSFDIDAADFTVDPSQVSRTAPVIDRNKALHDMFEANPSYLGSLKAVQGEDIRIAYAKNQRWPSVDLKASIGTNGYTNTLRDYTDATKLGMSYKDYWNRTQPTWSAGVVVNVPMFNKTAKSQLAEAKKRKLQALLELKRTENTLLAAFDTGMRDIANAAERVVLVKDSVRLAESALAAELKRLGAGLTTSYNVTQAQRDLSVARSRELATLVDLNKACTQFYFVVGTLNKELRIALIVD